MTDEIKAIGEHHGVGLHDCQGPDRIESVVRPEIDQVLDMKDPAALVAYCADVTKPPEARLLAAAKLQAGHQIAAEQRRVRPDVDLEYVAALVAGLNSRGWRSPFHYGSLLDHPRSSGEPGAAARTPEDRQAVEDDQRRLAEERRARP